MRGEHKRAVHHNHYIITYLSIYTHTKRRGLSGNLTRASGLWAGFRSRAEAAEA